ncbi:hypothetical protein PINS_up021747 [Pythium insidiosum]|nr:hypothetical protein PINS_up021747 [Pythium insidiosum]
MDINVVRHVQRMQLGPHGRSSHSVNHGAQRRVRPRAGASDCTSLRHVMARAFRCDDRATFVLHPDAAQPIPAFQLAFAHRSGRLVAVDEDGTVSIVHTDRRPSATPSSRVAVYEQAHQQWRAHENAIFDVVWTADDARVVTAAGDLQVCGWDVETQAKAFSLTSHSMSVKCVRQHPTSDWLFASGARDGHVMLWDIRAAHDKPVAQLPHVHAVDANAGSSSLSSSASTSSSSASFLSPMGSRKRRRTTVNATPRSVTCVEFTGAGHEIITAGAVDGLVKFWDVRRACASRPTGLKASAAAASTPRPVRVLSCSSREGTQRGISSLALDATRTRLLVNVLNDELRVYDIGASAVDAAPLPQLRCEGHVANSFYVKSCFSPDGDFITSGSGDGIVYLWDAATRHSTRDVRTPVLALKAHGCEANGVAWHRSDFTRLATCSDDGTVRLWTPDRRREQRVSVSDAGANAESFNLRRKLKGGWDNWDAFAKQDTGFAYMVQDLEAPVELPEPETKAIAASPPVIRRNPVAMAGLTCLTQRRAAAPVAAKRKTTRKIQFSQTKISKPRTVPQTLLDFWKR